MERIQSLEKRYHFQFLPAIAFECEESRMDIFDRGMLEWKNGRIQKMAISLGKKYRSLIEANYFAPSRIKWMGRRVGYGLFATEKNKKGQLIGEYAGIVRRNDRRYFEPLNHYCFEYPIPDSVGRSHVIDATKGNLARFINHSSHPNLKPVHVFIDGFFHVVLISIRDIEAGEHLAYDYGANYWYVRSPPVEI